MDHFENDSLIEIENLEQNFVRKRVNWIFVTIICGPLLLYIITLGIISSVTSMTILGGWQIWTFVFAVPVLSFIGGFFMKKE